MRHASLKYVAVAAAILLPSLTHARETGYREVSARGKGTARTQLGTLKNPVLKGFNLSFSNGDHELSQVALMQAKGKVTANFADRDRNDPMAMSAYYWAGGELHHGHTVTKRCRGVCTIPVRPAPRNTTRWQLALSGFSLMNMSGDEDIKVIAIEPTKDGNAYRVEFRGDKDFSFMVTLQYAWNYSRLAGPGGTRKARKFVGYRHRGRKTRDIKLFKNGAKLILQGFRAEYRNGAHHVRDFGFFQRGETYYARFNDNDYDDPVKATIYIGVL